MTSGALVSLVDDDESLRRSVKNLLSSVGFQVETFASAEAFLAAAALSKTSCLVLDLRLEGMSGLELMDHLSSAGLPIRVVMLTAHGDDEVRRRALKSGAVAFLTKPFRANDLLDAVRSVTESAG
jgi:FixJ family two-component response regulator